MGGVVDTLDELDHVDVVQPLEQPHLPHHILEGCHPRPDTLALQQGAVHRLDGVQLAVRLALEQSDFAIAPIDIEIHTGEEGKEEEVLGI